MAEERVNLQQYIIPGMYGVIHGILIDGHGIKTASRKEYGNCHQFLKAYAWHRYFHHHHHRG